MRAALLLLALSVVSARRVRKEFRSLSQTEWEEVVDAMWTMKSVSHAVGSGLYGRHFRTYDYFVGKHINASMHGDCDVAHFSPVFIVWHRAYELEWENALLAVNPNITGAHYWDYRLDASDPGGASGPFTEAFFGDWRGAESEGYQVTNGRFARWSVSQEPRAVTNWTSLYGFLRGPMNMNKQPGFTRNGGTICGIEVGVGNLTQWAACNELRDMRDWHYCIDFDVHGMAHFGVGGGWPRYATQRQHEIDEGPYHAPHCASFYGMVGDFVESRTSGSYVYPLNQGCLKCPACDAHVPEAECVCECAHAGCECAGVWTGARDVVEVITDPSLVEIVGDMYDPISSPNDPLFFFHHINLDRMWMSWQQAHADQAPYYGYPEDATLEPYCWAHLLDSNLGGHYPFFHLLEGQRGPLKVRDVFDLLNFESAPYEYDTLL